MKAKVASWQKFFTSNDNSEAWGFVYQQQAEKLRVERVISTLRQGEFSTNTTEEPASYLLDVHVPDDREYKDTETQKVVRNNAQIAPDTADAPLVTEREIVQFRLLKITKRLDLT